MLRVAPTLAVIGNTPLADGKAARAIVMVADSRAEPRTGTTLPMSSCSPPRKAMAAAFYLLAVLCRNVRRFFLTLGMDQSPNKLTEAMCVCAACRTCRVWR